MTRRAGIILFGFGVLSGCADRDADERLLPATAQRIGDVPMGNPAGPGERGAELVVNPFAFDEAARREGEVLFRSMNCAYCHGRSAEGGMGPSLVDGEHLFGETAVDYFHSVYEGRARGMPSYGALLGHEAVWKIVAYIGHLRDESGEPGRAGGQPESATRQRQEPGGRK